VCTYCKGYIDTLLHAVHKRTNTPTHSHTHMMYIYNCIHAYQCMYINIKKNI
jgi:hypothetical protein